MRKSIIKLKKCVPISNDEDTYSSLASVTKRVKSFSLLKSILTLLLFVFWGQMSAQTDTYMYWDQSVGCIEFDYDIKDEKRGIFFSEDIDNSSCIRVCEKSKVNYYIEGSNIANVSWNATGGIVQSTWTTPQHRANIQWGVAGSGALAVEITYTDNTVKNYILCIDIIHSPKPFFETQGNETTFCLNTPIQFDNLSSTNGGTDIIHYFWDFGDGNSSAEFEPEHSYDTPGSYTVVLTVTNKCNCSSNYKLDIEITPTPTIHISCPGVVCESKEKVTYTANDDCGGTWKIEGGTIISSSTGTSEITVVWDNVDPEDGFGYIHYTSDCGCPYKITHKVPVVLNHGIIKGESVVCLGKQNRYSLPQWPTTDFNWYLFPDTTPSQIIFVDQRNEVIVEGLVPGDYTLVCEYYNTLLGCKGDAKMKITVAPGVEVFGDEEFCSNSGNYTYTNSIGIPVDWTLKLDGSIVTTAYGVNFTYNFPIGGAYVLTATTAEGCSSEPFIINVTQTPSTPTGAITGEVFVCSGSTYEYSYNNTVPNTVLVWEATGGATIQGSNTGNEISVQFSGTGPYQVKVKRISTDTLGCASGELTLNVSSPTINPIITNDYGLSVFCPSSISHFTVDLGGIPADHIEWSISSSTSAINFGNIISGLNSTNVEVSFNEITSSATGILSVSVTRCGVTTTDDFPITLYQAPTLGITTPSVVCAEELFNVTLTSSSSLTSGIINWNVNGTPYTRNIAIDGLTLTGLSIDNLTDGNMTVNITASVTHPNGCHYNLTAAQTMTVKPRPDVQITPGYNFIVCPSNSYNINLHANINNATGPGSPTFQWYKNGSPLGITSSSLSINNSSMPSPGGSYYVIVTANGCSTTSNNIIILESCSSGPSCTLDINPNLNITADWTECNKINATANYNTGSYATSIHWTYPPTLLDIFGQGTDTPYFTTDVPGEYLLIVEVTYYTPTGPCIVTGSTTVAKHYEAKFNYTVTCNGNNEYTVELFNNSTLFDITESQLTFNYSTSGGVLTTSGTNATISNLLGGSSYTFTLNLQDTSSSYPVCTYTYTLNLPAAPNTNFTMHADPYHCSEDSIELVLDSYNPDNQYRWIFNGTSYIGSGLSTFINITNPGTHPVKLVVTNQYGCVFESTYQDVTIVKADFDGYLSPNPISICEGEAFSGISFTQTGGSSVLDTIIWMKGNHQVGTGLSYVPTQSGQYWGVLVDTNGCKFNGMVTNPVDVSIRKRPFVNITGSNSLCWNEETTLNGIVTDPSLERRWLLNGVPMSGGYGTWSSSTPTSLTVNYTTPGVYIYTFEVRPASDPGCGSSMDFSVTIHPQVTPPSLSYDVILCEPYTIKLSAAGPTTGHYNWSNGDHGQEIEVNAGGVYQVTYTAPTGCTATSQITVPHNANRYMWIFPEGCFDVCPWDQPVPYIIGPWGTFDYHEWIVNGNVVASGTSSQIFDLMVNESGTYQLYIEDGGCEYESGIAYITPNLEECNIKNCHLRFDFKDPEPTEDGTYTIDGYIINTYGFPITVNISSFNGFGTYSPSSVTIPPGGTYYFTPLTFIPVPGFNGGDDYMVISVPEIPCLDLHRVHFKKLKSGFTTQKTMVDQTDEVFLNVTPNPAEVLTAVSYNIGDKYQNAESISVYTMSGSLISVVRLDKNSGDILFDTSSFPSGVYIISLQANGNTVLHQKLIKK